MAEEWFSWNKAMDRTLSVLDRRRSNDVVRPNWVLKQTGDQRKKVLFISHEASEQERLSCS